MDTTKENDSSSDKTKRKSIHLNSTTDSTTMKTSSSSGARLYTEGECNGDINTSKTEFLRSSSSQSQDKGLADDTEQKLRLKTSIIPSTSAASLSSSSEVKEFQEIWRAVPRPSYAADVIYIYFSYIGKILYYLLLFINFAA